MTDMRVVLLQALLLGAALGQIIPAPTLVQNLDGTLTSSFVATHTPEKNGQTPAAGTLSLNFRDRFQIGVVQQVDLTGVNADLSTLTWKFVWYKDGGLISGVFPNCLLVTGTNVEDEANNGCWTDKDSNSARSYTPTLEALSSATFKVVVTYSVSVSGSIVESSPIESQIQVQVSDSAYVPTSWLPVAGEVSFWDTDLRLNMIAGNVVWTSRAIEAAQRDSRFDGQESSFFYRVSICNVTGCDLLQEFGVTSTTAYVTQYTVSQAIDISVSSLTHFKLELAFRDGTHDTFAPGQIMLIFVDKQATPGNEIESSWIGSFVDIDYEPYKIQGTLDFQRVEDDSPPEYLGYRLYLAVGSGISDRQGAPIQTLTIEQLGDKTIGTFTIPRGTAIVSTAPSFFQVVPYNHGGDSDYCAPVLYAKDLSSPTTAASNVTFLDTDLTEGRVAGSISFERGVDNEATYYYLYWANGTTVDARGQEISRIDLSIVGSSTATSLSFAIQSMILTSTHFQVVMVNQYGISKFAGSVLIVDRFVPDNSVAQRVSNPQFFDNNLQLDRLTGTLSFSSPDTVKGFTVWTATSSARTARQSRLVDLLRSNAVYDSTTQLYRYQYQLDYQVQSNLDSNLQLVPFNDVGQSSNAFYFPLTDRALPTATVSDLVVSDTNKDKGEFTLRLTFTRPQTHESNLRPQVLGYNIFIGQSSGDGTFTFSSIPDRTVTWQSLSPDVSVVGTSASVVLATFSDQASRSGMVAVRTYGSLGSSTTMRTATYTDQAIPLPSMVATNLAFRDQEELPDRIRGYFSFDLPCSSGSVTLWSVYLSSGSEYTNLTSGLINQALYSSQTKYAGGLSSAGGNFGALLKTLTPSSACPSVVNISIPTSLDVQDDVNSRLEPATNSLRLRNTDFHLTVVSSNNDGDCRFGSVFTIDDRASPRSVASGLTFVDQDLTLGSVQGTFNFTRAPVAEETLVDGYKVWFVPGYTRAQRLTEGVILRTFTLEELNLSQDRLVTLHIRNMTIDGTGYFHVNTYNKYGDAEAVVLQIVDKALPTVAAIEIAFTDQDVDQGQIYGQVTFKGIPDSSLVLADRGVTTGYRLYFATGPAITDRGSVIDEIAVCGPRVTSSCSGLYSIFLPFNLAISSFTHFHVVSFGAQGEGAFSVFQFLDVVGISQALQTMATTTAVAAAAAAGASSAVAGGMSGVSGAANAASAGGQASGASSSSSANAWGMIGNFQTTGANAQTSSDFPPAYSGYAQSMQWSNGDFGLNIFRGPNYTKEELAAAGASRISNGRTPEANFLQLLLLCLVVIGLDVVALSIFWYFAQKRLEKRIAEEYRKSDHIELFDEHQKELERQRKEEIRKQKLEEKKRKIEEKNKNKPKKPEKVVEKVPKQWTLASLILRLFVILYYALLTAAIFQVKNGKSLGISALALIVIVLIGFGLPVGTILLIRNRNHLNQSVAATENDSEVDTMKKQLKKLAVVFGPVLTEYKDDKKWFTVVQITRKALMAICVVLLFGSGKAQAIMMFVIFLITLLLLGFDPYPEAKKIDARMEATMCFLNLYTLSVAAFVPVHIQNRHPEIGKSLVAGQMLCIGAFIVISFNSIRVLVVNSLAEREKNLRELAKFRIEQRKKELALAMNNGSDHSESSHPTANSKTLDKTASSPVYQDDYYDDDADLYEQGPEVEMARVYFVDEDNAHAMPQYSSRTSSGFTPQQQYSSRSASVTQPQYYAGSNRTHQ